MWTLWLSDERAALRHPLRPVAVPRRVLADRHRHAGGDRRRSPISAASLGRLLGNPVFNWVGTRSYGLYLYHWPIYQIIRGEAGSRAACQQFVLAMVITVPITEASYRFVETADPPGSPRRAAA